MNFTLDTNVLIDAVRSPVPRAELEHFLRWATHRVEISSVVALELEAGARTAASRVWIEEQFLAPFERRGRIVPPSKQEWRRAGRLLSSMPEGTQRPSRQNDALLAVQARERGWIVITRDRDFAALRAQVAGLMVIPPFPVVSRS